MSNYPQYLLTTPLAVDGDKTIPPATAQSAGTGRFSQAEGWREYNAKPIGEGGIPPKREDFNGAFYLLSQFIYWYQQGGIMQYSASIDYEANNEVYANGVKYRCLQANGPSSSVIAPNASNASEYWENLDSGEVRWDKAQSLTTAQQAQARENIDVLSTQESATNLANAIAGFVAFNKAQALTDAQKLQARTNIGAIQESDISGFVSFATAQNLTTAQRKQARDNIAVPSSSEVTSQINSAVGAVNSAFVKVIAIGSTVSSLSGGTTISVVVHCQVYHDIYTHTESRVYSVNVDGSSIGTVTLNFKDNRTGGAGFGRQLSCTLVGYFSTTRTIAKGASISVTLSSSTLTGTIQTEFAQIMIC